MMSFFKFCNCLVHSLTWKMMMWLKCIKSKQEVKEFYSRGNIAYHAFFHGYGRSSCFVQAYHQHVIHTYFLFFFLFFHHHKYDIFILFSHNWLKLECRILKMSKHFVNYLCFTNIVLCFICEIIIHACKF